MLNKILTNPAIYKKYNAYQLNGAYPRNEGWFNIFKPREFNLPTKRKKPHDCLNECKKNKERINFNMHS